MDCMVILFLIFWGTSILLSIVVLPVYTPTNSAQEFPFLHILSNTCYLWSLIIAILTGVRYISLWSWFAYPWWLVMLSTFSCVCWPSVCLLWKMSIQVLCPFFNWVVCMFVCLFLMLGCMHSLYILDINPLSDISSANIFSQ